MKPTANFASGHRRFDEASATTAKSPADGGPGVQVAQPGPGQYEINEQWVKLKNIKGTWSINPSYQKDQSKDSQPSGLVAAAPSIPSHEYIFGYEENDVGQLVRQKNTEKVHKGEGNDRVGPGAYNPLPSKRKSTKVTEWKEATKHTQKIRVIQEEKRGPQPGPGFYDHVDPEQPPQYTRPSSFFSSGVKRTQFGLGAAAPSAQEKNMKNGNQAKNDSQQSVIQDIIENENEYEYPPGPGQYNTSHHDNGFSTGIKPICHQFFGSTSGRFEQKAQSQTQSSSLGPGSYDVKKNTSKARHPQAKSVPFLSNSNRCADAKLQKNNDYTESTEAVTQVPGPGTYQQPGLASTAMTRAYGRSGVFGCTERRFANITTLKTPGPGAYAIQETLDTFEGAAHKNPILSKSSSMFISNQSRGFSSVQHNNSQFGKTRSNRGRNTDAVSQGISHQEGHIIQYDTTVHTIEGNMRKKNESITNPLLAKLVKQQTRNAFNTHGPRFNEKPTKEDSKQFLGPGYYENSSQFDLKLHKQLTRGLAKNQVSATCKANARNSKPQTHFISTAQRFQDNPAAKAKMTLGPGPGTYEDPRVLNWGKRSYNIDFSEE